MEHKQSLDDFIDELNMGAKQGEFITYTWWPENYLKIQMNGKTFIEIIGKTPDKSYKAAEREIKRLIRRDFLKHVANK
jgi:hypothetical protein